MYVSCSRIKISILLLVLLSTYCAQSLDTKHKVLNIFAPKQIRNFENIGSQENFYWTIPAEYSSAFDLGWNGFVATTGSGIVKDCSNATAQIVVGKYGIPHSNPLNTSSPENTFVQQQEYIIQNFTISSSNNTFVMRFSGNSSVDEDYYAAVYLLHDTDTSSCGYAFSLTVIVNTKTRFEPPVNTFTPTVNTTSSLYLPRIEKDFVDSSFKTFIFGYNLTTLRNYSMYWEVEDYVDTGGTLYLTHTIMKQNFSENVTLYSQLYWQQSNMENSYEFFLNGKVDQDVTETWYWPYPRSGKWVLVLAVDCNKGLCEQDVKIYVKIGITSCIENCHSSKYQGSCKKYMTNAIQFVACDCKAGWAGIGCTDGRNALSYSKQMAMTLLLTLSNIIFLPCTFLAIKRKYYTEAAIYFFVAFFSSFYHACDEPGIVVLCIMKYDTLQYSDFLGSNAAFWFTIIAIASLPYHLESLFHVAGLLCIAVGVEYNRFSVWVTVVPIMVGLALLSLKWGRQCANTRSCYPPRNTWLLSLVPGVVFAVIGLVLYSFIETDDNYWYVHSMWHILMGTSILFLLPKEKQEGAFWSLSNTSSSCTSSVGSVEGPVMLNYENASISM